MMGNGRKYAALISRFGEKVEIHERGEGDKNVFNNPQSKWEHVDTVTCAVVKPEDTMKSRLPGGERKTSVTTLIFPSSISIPSNFRIVRKLTGEKFEVENTTKRRSYTEANAVEVTE
jgi:hypothetical protein